MDHSFMAFRIAAQCRNNSTRVTLLACSVLALSMTATELKAEPAQPKRRVEGGRLHMTGKQRPQTAPFDALMKSFIETHKIPGASLAVTRGGRLVYARGFGFADRDLATPVEPDSLFRIASISKPITAVAVVQLVERGKLNLTDKVFELLSPEPYHPPGRQHDPRLKQITVLQLLHHTGGWDRDKSFDPMFRSVDIAKALGAPPPAVPEQIIRFMTAERLDFDPGERYAYSNFGYCLLGRVIEKVSGQSYGEYVRQQVLQPVGVRDMRLGATLPAGRAPREVKYYAAKNETGPAVMGPKIGEQVPLPYGHWYLEAMDAHGGWIASAVDLVRFARAFDKPEHCKILQPQSIQTLFSRPVGSAGHEPDGKPKASYYGCGWQVRPVGNGGAANHWHTGSLDGTATLLVRRHDGLNWAVLFNTRKEGDPTLNSLIDPLLHVAADAVKQWPMDDQFPSFK